MFSIGWSSFRTRAGCVGVALAVVAVLLGGEPAQGGTVGGTLERWHRVEISFQGPTHAESDSTPNPFLDYRLLCLFTGPSGQTFNVPGFFDADGAGGTSGSVWKCRFAPDEVGGWTYAASFRAGADVAVSLDPTAGAASHFDGDAGNFVVAASTASGEDFRAPDRGFLTNPGGHYLRFQGSGDPWLKGGPDIPENFLGYTGFDNTPSAGHPFSAHVADWNPGDPDWGGGQAAGSSAPSTTSRPPEATASTSFP